MSFGRIIRERRTALGIGMTDMADRLGISAAYWSRIERDMESPPRDTDRARCRDPRPVPG